jgi:hypothetical protein
MMCLYTSNFLDQADVLRVRYSRVRRREGSGKEEGRRRRKEEEGGRGRKREEEGRRRKKEEGGRRGRLTQAPREELRAIGIGYEIQYKADIHTIIGIYGKNSWGIPEIIYSA